MSIENCSEFFDALLSLIEEIKLGYQEPNNIVKRGRKLTFSHLSFLFLAVVAVSLRLFPKRDYLCTGFKLVELNQNDSQKIMKILVAGMGNVLRGDDGFGIRVVEELTKNHTFTKGVDIYEAGIGGISLVQELMNGYEALIVVDAVEKNAAAGTLFVLKPLDNKIELQNLELHQAMVDMHYADPSKVLLMAKALNVCPPIVFLVGCQPEYVDEAVEGLRPSVARAVPHAVREVLALIDELLKTNAPLI